MILVLVLASFGTDKSLEQVLVFKIVASYHFLLCLAIAI